MPVDRTVTQGFRGKWIVDLERRAEAAEARVAELERINEFDRVVPIRELQERVAELEATVGYALDELEQIDTHHRTNLDRTRAFHARGALRRALKGDEAK